MRHARLSLLVALAATASVAGAQPAWKGKGRNRGGSGGAPAPAPAPTPAAPTPGFGGTVLSREWSVCGGPSLTALLCAEIQVAVDGTTTTVRVRNFSGAPEITAGGAASAGQWVLTTVGFDGVAESAGAFVTAVGATSGAWLQPTAAAPAPAAWVAHDDRQYGGGVNVDLAIDNGGGVGDGLASSCAPTSTLPGGSNRLWITAVSGCDAYSIAAAAANDGWLETRLQTIQSWDPNAPGVSAFFKGQNGPGGASWECSVGGADPRGGCADAEVYAADVPTGAVVPEPRTVVLVATGLLGMLAPAARRRFGRPPARPR